MQANNGIGDGDHHTFEQRVDAFEDRGFAEPREESRFTTVIEKVTETIKAHPVAAAAVALGLGYVLTRSVRR